MSATATTTAPHPVWDPITTFPIDIAKADVETLVGTLLALLEHLQIFAIRSYDRTQASQNHSATISSPWQYVPKLVSHARHHIQKVQRRSRSNAHELLLDKIVTALPADLPVFIQMPRRWKSERSYRITHRHLVDTYAAYKTECAKVNEPEDVVEDEDEGVE